MDRLCKGGIGDPISAPRLTRDEFRKVQLVRLHLFDRQRLAFRECPKQFAEKPLAEASVC
jgi:hypothetical protein